MIIPLFFILQFNYPTIIFNGPLGNVQLGDKQDGNGAVILKWNVPDVSQPTLDQIVAFQTNNATQLAYCNQQAAITNASILEQLNTLDLQSIRALREPSSSSTTKLTNLTNQATALRAQLVSVATVHQQLFGD